MDLCWRCLIAGAAFGIDHVVGGSSVNQTGILRHRQRREGVVLSIPREASLSHLSIGCSNHNLQTPSVPHHTTLFITWLQCTTNPTGVYQVMIGRIECGLNECCFLPNQHNRANHVHKLAKGGPIRMWVHLRCARGLRCFPTGAIPLGWHNEKSPWR